MFLFFVCFRFFFKICIFISKADLQRKKKREWEEKGEWDWVLSYAGSLPKCESGSGFVDLSGTYRSPNTWAISHCFCRHISGELDWKFSSQDLNQECHWRQYLNGYVIEQTTEEILWDLGMYAAIGIHKLLSDEMQTDFRIM